MEPAADILADHQCAMICQAHHEFQQQYDGHNDCGLDQSHGEENWKMTRINKPMPKLRKAPQPPLSQRFSSLRRDADCPQERGRSGRSSSVADQQRLGLLATSVAVAKPECSRLAENNR
jgi:hypothetical protein